MIELEKTYLAKYLPQELKQCESKEIIDIYIPKESRHPVIRIRKNGNKYEITKKEPINVDDSSEMLEQTIVLTQDEFNTLKNLDGKKVRKIRYYYNYKKNIAEIDVFQDELKGLVVVDFEFKTIKEKNEFIIPDFCAHDITQDEFVAGGMICGKTYDEIKKILDKYNYKKLFLE
jgi:adenylate cyclase